MKPLEAPVGTFVLCDHVSQDRGKWNILGVGWTAIPPTRSAIQTFVTLHIPSAPPGERNIEVTLTLYEPASQSGDLQPLVSTSASLDVEIPGPDDEDGLGVPPSYIGYLPMELRGVELKPECGYVIELEIDGSPQNVIAFGTTHGPAAVPEV